MRQIEQKSSAGRGRSAVWLLAAAVAVLASPGLAGDNSAPAPGSLESVLANNPIAVIAKGPNLWTTVEEPKDWVKASRPKQPAGFMPVGITPPARRLKIKTPAELAAMQTDFEKTSQRMQKLGHGKATLASVAQPLLKKRKTLAPNNP